MDSLSRGADGSPCPIPSSARGGMGCGTASACEPISEGSALMIRRLTLTALAASRRCPRSHRATRSTSTTGPTTSPRTRSRSSRRRPGSRSSTTSTTRTRCWRRSCSPATRATTWWCRPRSSCSARSAPGSTSRSTSRSCRTSPNMDPELMETAAAYDPGNEHAVIYMWGTTGIGYNVAAVAERLGRRRAGRQLGAGLRPGERREARGLRHQHARLRRPTCCRARSPISGSTRRARSRRTWRRRRR